MSTAPKLAQRTVHTNFDGQQAQKLAQETARKTNSHADMLAALQNRAYVALTTDYTQAAAATYATLISTTITTVLATGYLIITFSASGQQITNASIDVFQVTVDGVSVGACYQSTVLAGVFSASMVTRAAVTRGRHTVALQTKVNNNSLTIRAATVNEEHAHLLVQEAA